MLIGVKVEDIQFKAAAEVQDGFLVICLRCAGKGGSAVEIMGLTGCRVSVTCVCGNNVELG